MIQFHSIVISEPAAQLCGRTTGLLTYGLLGQGASHDIRLGIAMGMSVLFNVVIGAKINLLMLDFLAAISVRPVSAIVCAKLLAMIVSASM
jgi:hypothetical protein